MAENDKDGAAKAKDKEREAKRKDKEKAAKEKEKAAKAKQREKDKAARDKEKEREAKAKAKQREDRDKEKAREEKAKERRAAQRAANAKEKDREAKAKAKQREARQKEKDREAKAADKAHAKRAAKDQAAQDQVATPVEEVAVPGRGEAEPVPASEPAEAETATEGATTDGTATDGQPALPELDVPGNDKTVRPKGYLAETLGREDAVERSTQRATLAASYTTRDHDIIRAWATTRGGRPADVAGTGGRRGSGTAGVLRIEFPDGPGDDSRLEDIDWAPFFETFDSSDVDFLYQERVRTGDVSRFHKIVRAAS